MGLVFKKVILIIIIKQNIKNFIIVRLMSKKDHSGYYMTILAELNGEFQEE